MVAVAALESSIEPVSYTHLDVYKRQEGGFWIMNIGFWICGVLVIPFLVIGILFAFLKDRAAKFVSGFNSLPEKEQILYDKAHISRDIRNQCFIWSATMAIGAVLSYFVTQYMAIPTFIVWLFLFFKDVHFDTHKAFEKYLLK